MTESRTDNDRTRLEALYRRAGDVEPDAGLDRIINARADDAIRGGRSSALRPWLGGLVTASVAIVAIAVVLQQSPPADRTSISPAAPAPEETGAYMAPSLGADAKPESAPAAQRARNETRQLHSPARSAEPEPQPSASALDDSASLTNREMRAAESREVVEQESAEFDLAEDRSGMVADKAAVDSDGIVGAEAMLERIAALIEDGEFGHARESLGEFRRRFPDYPIPEQIEESLEPLD